MRRKSERAATKKAKASPEKKLDKVKRTRTRRRKQSASSENDSADEVTPVQEKEIVNEPVQKPPLTPGKEDSPEDAPDQVWRVKSTEGGDVGEIQKLKICLTRPPSTPERVDRSPRSKRKHSRATSSSDTPSCEGVEEKKKSKRHSKRSTRESKDESEKNHDSQEEPDVEVETSQDKSSNEISQSTKPTEESISDNTPMSTTNEEVKVVDSSENKETVTQEKSQDDSIENLKSSDADTTVASPKVETTAVSSEVDANETVESHEPSSFKPQKDSSEDKSEVLELHAEDNRCEPTNTDTDKSKKVDTDKKVTQDGDQVISSNDKVSKTEDETDSNSSKKKKSHNEHKKSTDDVVENREQKTDDGKENSTALTNDREEDKQEKHLERTDSTQSAPEDTIAAPIVVSRKRRWGSRPNKSTSTKSLTISTDVLKEIIPDVKPAEFDEVIEEKKNKREVIEKLERPVLPKIIIDNSENVENNKRHEEKEKDIVKPRDIQMLSNRKISIVKENDSIITRPPSPPRHKQSCILYITNLVRPFTLPQLRNLLQRTGRIVEDGFWIDRIKSKCFIKYENEDQAVETRHALHGVTWPVSNPKTLQVDFSTDEAFQLAKTNEDTDKAQISTIPGTVEDWLREQDMKRERGEMDKSFERKAAMREWDMGKNEKDKDGKDKLRRPDDRPMEKRRHRSLERSPEPAKKFKKKEEEAPAKLLDDLFRKTKTTPCIYWLPLSAETIAIKEEQRRQHMAEHERRLQELRRTHRRH
ncbi:unnamed protein product [Chilo suppressalis]|uniref:RRM domain-containing protein n=1 Tax=Chilo suppressalis TaxID=168631 RepID=A0ABN8LAX0_CHISP|nr:unnamed protein product [Chilo suppressalis]